MRFFVISIGYNALVCFYYGTLTLRHCFTGFRVSLLHDNKLSLDNILCYNNVSFLVTNTMLLNTIYLIFYVAKIDSIDSRVFEISYWILGARSCIEMKRVQNPVRDFSTCIAKEGKRTVKFNECIEARGAFFRKVFSIPE